MAHLLSHMTSVCWKESPSKEGVTLQNSSTLGSASFSWQVWEGSWVLHASEQGAQGDVEMTGKAQSRKLCLIRPEGLWGNTGAVS